MIKLDGIEKKDLFETCVKFFCDLLGIDIPCHLHIFVDDDLQVNGQCFYNGHDEFMVVLKNREEGHMLVTLAHELTHVKQYKCDNLEDRFDSSVPYQDRWWEQEAFENEVTLVKELIKELRK